MKYFVKMVDTGSLTPVAEMADKFLVQAKRFPSNIIGRNYGASAFGDDTETSGFYRAFPEGFFHQPVFCVRVNPLIQQPFDLVTALSGISKEKNRRVKPQ
ncbi:hypothetical protein A3219_01470 [Salmonella enterica]|nr:hypothetical protein A3219_01470 [Salmonella enterica]